MALTYSDPTEKLTAVPATGHLVAMAITGISLQVPVVFSDPLDTSIPVTLALMRLA